MSARPDPGELRRWQEAVARDPASAYFVPLADLYRREGKLDVARRLCARGLARSPEHVDGHVLLGRIYREAGDLDRAADEFDIALHLQPDHGAARRALGYLCLERRDWECAVRHLASAAEAAPEDARVASALALARRHVGGDAATPTRDPALLARAVERFAAEARAQLVLLTESSGRIVLRHGYRPELDLAALASLGAGVHAASRALARLLGEARFRRLHHGDAARQLLLAGLATAGAELLLLAVFGPEATLGLVRVHLGALEQEVASLAAPAPAPAASFEAELAAGLRLARDLPPPSPR